jgi:hypothetical protein
MNAIELLESQHREVEELFESLEDADGEEKDELFAELADALAVHATIEEKHLYPASVGARTEEMLREAVEEHLAIKRIVADLLEMSSDDENFDAKIKVLKEQVEHHVEEEESDLFPAIDKMLGKEKLESIGAAMAALAEELEAAGDPRDAVPEETAEAAPIEASKKAKRGRPSA